MIVYDKAGGRFVLSTKHSSYHMAVTPEGWLCHTWYGRRTEGALSDPRPVHRFDEGCWPELLPFECAGPGLGDSREPSVVPEYLDGTQAADFRFRGAEMSVGKYGLGELPGFRGGGDAESLSITMADAAGLEVELLYCVYEDEDLITRSARYVNRSADAPVKLRAALSLCLDFEDRALELMTFNGKWAAERTPERFPIRSGIQSVGSLKGIPGHVHSPSVVLCRPDTGEAAGDCWGFTLVYSGNFLARAEKSEAGIRLCMGIHPQHFCWTLAPGDVFTAPEAAMVFSPEGFGGMSRRLHRAIRRYLLPEGWNDPARPRPVLLNSWEAFYFDYDAEKLLALATAGKQAGIDLFVVDDGWFRKRDSTKRGLGDWTAEPSRFPEGLPDFCGKLNRMGLDMGIWVEPEAVSPDSDLYRAHPDWALQIPGRKTLELRDQYTLDFSRLEVRDEIWRQLRALLDSCPIRYVKWDMNRMLANAYSAALPPERQGEVYHRYVLGVYDLQRRLAECYPDILFENCASGGGRFDCGMLAFSPQIWCSDNTDALDRLTIQHGTSFFFPACCVGAHFSASPNDHTGRASSVEARMLAALSGTFGFELDLTVCGEGQLAELKRYIDWYRTHGALIRGGDLYRLVPPELRGSGAAWMYVSPARSEAAVFAVGSALDGDGSPRPRLQLAGLDADAVYTDGDGVSYTGSALLLYGLPLPGAYGDIPAKIWYLKREVVAQ